MDKSFTLLSLFLVLFLVVSFSCSTTQFKDEKEFNAYLLDKGNGYMQDVVRQNFKVQLLYRPTDLLVAQELREPFSADTSQINSLKRKYENYRYFILSISSNGQDALNASTNYAAFSENLSNLAFKMGDYVNMTTSANDTIPVADYHFPRLYGGGGATQLLFAFHKEEMKNTEWVQFNLLDIGMGFGDTIFRFETKKILEEPKLAFIP